MKHIGLFEGIGGFSLASRWMGWETIAWCEWDEFCKKVLKHHFPEAEQHGDITTTDFTRYAGQIDVLTGGFPCQPYSSAGKRLGKEDDRHLWPEMLRAIREIQPRWVVGENVRGLTNWNAGLVFDEVQADLENEATKSHRIYFQLAPSTLPIDGIESGLLLSTPSRSPMADITEERATEKGWVWKGTAWYLQDGSKVQKTLGHQIAMLPTPRKSSFQNSKMKIDMGAIDSLTTMAIMGLLPTPATRDSKGANSMEHLTREADGNSHQDQLPNFIKLATGSSSQLNPQFVAEMMGFPTDWLKLPFLSTEKSQ